MAFPAVGPDVCLSLVELLLSRFIIHVEPHQWRGRFRAQIKRKVGIAQALHEPIAQHGDLAGTGWLALGGSSMKDGACVEPVVALVQGMDRVSCARSFDDDDKNLCPAMRLGTVVISESVVAQYVRVSGLLSFINPYTA